MSKPVFDPQKVKEATSTTIPPCIECGSPKTIAVRRIDLIYAVTKCIDCLHLRPLTKAEYLREWPCEHEFVDQATNACTKCSKPIRSTRCNYLCGPHLEQCDLDRNENDGLHEGICRCEKCPTRPRPQ